MTLPTIVVVVFRETLEALLIIATVLTALKKLKLDRLLASVYFGTALAAIISFTLLAVNAFVGQYLQSWYLHYEEHIEAVLAIVSAIFLTWAALFLHETFRTSKLSLLNEVNNRLTQGSKTIAALSFIAVFREGIEVVFFLMSAYFTLPAAEIVLGVFLGIFSAALILWLIFRQVVRISLHTLFRLTTISIILLAAGLLAQGVHELNEIQFLPATYPLTLWFVPVNNLGADLLKGILGITRSMDLLAVVVYLAYVSSLTKVLLFTKYEPPTTTKRTSTAQRAGETA